jgi:hypothetical protein
MCKLATKVDREMEPATRESRDLQQAKMVEWIKLSTFYHGGFYLWRLE